MPPDPPSFRGFFLWTIPMPEYYTGPALWQPSSRLCSPCCVAQLRVAAGAPLARDVLEDSTRSVPSSQDA